jgi:hypothetical protein
MLFASGQLLKICGTLRLLSSSVAQLLKVCARLRFLVGWIREAIPNRQQNCLRAGMRIPQKP